MQAAFVAKDDGTAAAAVCPVVGVEKIETADWKDSVECRVSPPVQGEFN